MVDCPETLRVATVESLFSMNIGEKKTGSFKLLGIDGIIFHIFQKVLNIPFELVIAEDAEWGRSLQNGSWTGMVGKVQKGEADIAINTLAMTEERLKVIDFSHSYVVDKITFAVPKPGAYPNSLAFIQAFDLTVWISIVFVFFLTPLLFRCLLNSNNSYIQIMFQLSGLLLKQSVNFNLESYKNVVLFLSWCFFAAVVTLYYSANLSSFLTVPLEMPFARNFKELSDAVSRGSLKCFAAKGTFAINTLVNSQKEHLRDLGETIIRNEWYFSGDSLKSLTADSYTAVMTGSSLLKMVAGLEVWKSYYLSDDSIMSFNIGVVMKKDFCYKEKLNKIISRFNSAGLYDKIIRDESFKLWITNSKEVPKTLLEIPLSLADFLGPFIILSVGLCLATMCFIFEIKCSNLYIKC
ncbi:uncharacterized protein TNIN_50441 [Trichonephila inaurata madagascariensis]|uniref:Uncharacterized protein n=1 Tax=Trichonephila inaurata madagascariensis TaxID=2747483 RepID=A0A8X6Y950_9ARAC|nr:uncharacterized protein TNIN_50441 [Trichonephila inaurata madagascariensis]